MKKFEFRSVLMLTLNRDFHLKLMIWFYSIALAHLIFIGLRLLTVDFTTASDPRIWVYQEYRWSLITTWFNLLNYLYLPASIYCVWREFKHEHDIPHVKWLNKFRSTLFSSILLPSTVFSDIMFWRLWNMNREYLAPVTVDEVIPYWSQHSMHTVTLVVVLLDLVIEKRKRPPDIVRSIFLTLLFVATYSSVMIYYTLQGKYIYPFIASLTYFKKIILFVLVFVEFSFYNTVQWFINEIVWG